MDPMPLAGQFCRTREEAQSADRYPLTWIECQQCGLVQVVEDIDDRVLFSNYNYASSTVPGLVRHFDAYADFLIERFGRTPTRLLEIGCNDGVLLRRLPAEWDLMGVDPSDVARDAADKNYKLQSAPFTKAMAATLSDAGQFDVVTGSNCLAHISDLLDIFEGVQKTLRIGGEFIIEVHDLAATVDTGQWDTIYHEHKAEWSAESLAACLAPLGFEPSFLMRLPLHGGLLRAGFRKVGASAPGQVPGNRSYQVLTSAYLGRRQTETYHAVSRALEAGKAVSAYGASGRANVWLNQLPELRLSYVVDDSPLRNGKWLPCVATPVVPAQNFIEKPTNFCIITAWNFAADIRAKYPHFSGQWLQSLDVRSQT
jgi:SAM-dependent methyltransferase